MLDIDTAVRGEIARLSAARAALHADLLERVAELDAAELWRDDGSASAAGWLVAHHGLSHRTAAEWVRVARALGSLPELRRRYAAGELSWDQLRAVTRFADPDTDAEWADLAPEMSAGRLEREARRRERVPLDSARRAFHNRRLDFSWSEAEHGAHLRGFLPDDYAATVARALARIVNRSPAHPETGVFEHYPVRLADALYEMASGSLGADADPDRATVVVHVDAATLAGGAGVPEVEDGPALASETARRMMCDCRYEAALVDQEGRTIGIGRTSRSIPPWLGRQVRRRDEGCRFPGCERVRWVQIHHVLFWGLGGRTDLDNLISLCGYHHRLVHEDGWRIAGDPNQEVTWVRPDGTPWQAHGLMLNKLIRGNPEAIVPYYLRNGEGRASIDTS